MMDRRLAEWFAGRGVGTSSKAIALWLAAGVRSDGPPSDTSDLKRCLALLDAIPEWKSRMGEMAEAGERWKPFAERWPELVSLFVAEKAEAEKAGRDSAPQTYALMQELRGHPGHKPGLHFELGAP